MFLVFINSRLKLIGSLAEEDAEKWWYLSSQE
jgi:hypothetical protein